MMMYWFLILTLLPLVLTEQRITSNRIIHVLTRALDFLSANIEQVNLDAGIGTRMAADQLRFYTQCQSIRKLVDQSEYVTRQIEQSVRYRQADYYNQLSFLLQPGIFSTLIPFRIRRNQDEIDVGHDCSLSPFVEKHSDQCLHDLAVKNCRKNRACFQLMSDSNACRYSLTHQLFYSIVSNAFSCQNHRLSSKNQHRLIQRMFNESQTIASNNFHETDRDLFMEQIAFGGLLGWADFFQENHWFESIVSWQHPIEGCYGNDTIHIEKREEMQMSHDCLSHRTSVAIAALSQILRYMLSRDI